MGRGSETASRSELISPEKEKSAKLEKIEAEFRAALAQKSRQLETLIPELVVREGEQRQEKMTEQVQTKPAHITSQVLDQPDEPSHKHQKTADVPPEENQKPDSPSPTVQDIIPGDGSKEKLEDSQQDFEGGSFSKQNDSHSQHSSQNKLADNSD